MKTEDTICIKWQSADVKSIASDLTDNECQEVLRLAKKNHDATIGINWDVLEAWAEYVRSERKQL